MTEFLDKKPKKIPKWLEIDPRFPSLSDRPRLKIDELEENPTGEGTALDTVPHRPGYRLKILKKISRTLAEAEELKSLAEKKYEKGFFPPDIDLFKSLVEEIPE